MTKMFYPNDGRPAIQVSSERDIAECMGEIINDFGPIEVNGDLVLTQLNGQFVEIGKLR